MSKRPVIMEDLILTKHQILFEVPDNIPDDEIAKWLCASKERYDSCIVNEHNFGQVDYDFHIVDADTFEEIMPWMGKFNRE